MEITYDFGLRIETGTERPTMYCRYLQNVQDTVIHLEVDEDEGSGRSHKEVRGKPSGYGPHVRCLVYGYQMLLITANYAN